MSTKCFKIPTHRRKGKIIKEHIRCIKSEKKDYDLYRHHSDEFEAQINNSKDFKLDKERRFNHTGMNKNEGELYFYSTTKQGAEMYSDDEFNSTKLREYKVKANLLDLRDENNRWIVKRTIIELQREENKIKQNMIKHVHAKILDPRAKKRTTRKDIIKNNAIDGYGGFWGQKATDFRKGKILKSELSKLGFDGIIFKSGMSEEIALFNNIAKKKKP